MSGGPGGQHPGSPGLSGAGVPVCVDSHGVAGENPPDMPELEPPAVPVLGEALVLDGDDDNWRNLKLEALSL